MSATALQDSDTMKHAMHIEETNLGPSSEQDIEAAAHREEVFARIAEKAGEGIGVQVAPTAPSAPLQIDRADLLEYKLYGSRAATAELQVVMYSRELQRSQAEVSTIAHEGRQYIQSLEKKYGVDLTTNMITDDGYLVPRPVADRMNQLRR